MASGAEMGQRVKPVLCILLAAAACKPSGRAPIKPTPRICGMTYSHIWTGQEGEGAGEFSPRSRASLEELAALGIKRIAITPHGWMDSLEATTIKEHAPGLKRAYRDQIRLDAAQARRLGMEIMVKPHVIVKGDKWVARAKPAQRQGGWAAWFRSYKGFILDHARFAEEIGATWLSLGVELNSAVVQNPMRWRPLIHEARRLFSGKLTYTSTFDYAERVTFWSLLDAVGVALFGDLAQGEGASQEQLEGNALRWRKRLTRVAGIHKIPLILTEVGFVNRRGAAKDPWRWPEDLKDPRRTAEGDRQQAMAYRAIIQAFGGAPEVEAIYWWKWFDDPQHLETAQAVGYSPRGKPAAQLLKAACGG